VKSHGVSGPWSAPFCGFFPCLPISTCSGPSGMNLKEISLGNHPKFSMVKQTGQQISDFFGAHPLLNHDVWGWILCKGIFSREGMARDGHNNAVGFHRQKKWGFLTIKRWDLTYLGRMVWISSTTNFLGTRPGKQTNSLRTWKWWFSSGIYAIKWWCSIVFCMFTRGYPIFRYPAEMSCVMIYHT